MPTKRIPGNKIPISYQNLLHLSKETSSLTVLCYSVKLYKLAREDPWRGTLCYTTVTNLCHSHTISHHLAFSFDCCSPSHPPHCLSIEGSFVSYHRSTDYSCRSRSRTPRSNSLSFTRKDWMTFKHHHSLAKDDLMITDWCTKIGASKQVLRFWRLKP